MWVFVLWIEKFYNLKPTTIYIEMDVSFVIIRSVRFPYLRFIIRDNYRATDSFSLYLGKISMT